MVSATGRERAKPGGHSDGPQMGEAGRAQAAKFFVAVLQARAGAGRGIVRRDVAGQSAYEDAAQGRPAIRSPFDASSRDQLADGRAKFGMDDPDIGSVPAPRPDVPAASGPHGAFAFHLA